MEYDLRLRKKPVRYRKPATAIHYGNLVYANRAFPSLLEFTSFTDLKVRFLTDVTVGLEKSELRKPLTVAGNTRKSDKYFPDKKIAPAKKDGSQLPPTPGFQLFPIAGRNRFCRR